MSASERTKNINLDLKSEGRRARVRSADAPSRTTVRWLLTGVLLTVLLPLCCVGVPPVARAQDGSDVEGLTAAESIEPRETIFTLIIKGGWIMLPIGLCSLLVATVSIERMVSLRGPRVASPDLVEELTALVPNRGALGGETRDNALALCNPTALVDRVLLSGIERLHREEGPVVEALEEAAARESHKLRRKIRPLAMVAALSPLLGLLGTIYGMITCFENAVAADTASRAATLASGIYVALVSTAAGMSVAIPAMLLHFYFQGRVDRITDTVDEAATSLVEHYFGVPAPTTSETLSVKRARTERREDRSAKARS